MPQKGLHPWLQALFSWRMRLGEDQVQKDVQQQTGVQAGFVCKTMTA
jgi:hypothetical protein